MKMDSFFIASSLSLLSLSFFLSLLSLFLAISLSVLMAKREDKWWQEKKKRK